MEIEKDKEGHEGDDAFAFLVSPEFSFQDATSCVPFKMLHSIGLRMRFFYLEMFDKAARRETYRYEVACGISCADHRG